MSFGGKFTFQSTNASGPLCFLSPASSQGLHYPAVCGAAAGRAQTWIVTAASDGKDLMQMGDLRYLGAVEEVGWVTGATGRADAYPIRVTPYPDGQVSLSIFIAARHAWEPISYTVNTLLPYLVFAPSVAPVAAGGDLPSYVRLRVRAVTPSLAEIQRTGSARHCDLRDVDLGGADLRGVDCSWADFSNAILDDVDFAGANLSHCQFGGASLNNTNLSGATLDHAAFIGARLGSVIWGKGIRARGADFSRAIAVACRIGAPAAAPRADFTGALLTGADFSHADLRHAILAQAKLLEAVLVGADLSHVDFTSAQLGGVDRSAAAKLSFAYMPNVNFNQANLFGVDFSFSTLFGASGTLTGTATMEQADFSNAYLEGINLSGATLRGANFSNACLVNVTLTAADLSPTLGGSIVTSLAGACLQGCNFTQARLASADLSEATVSFTRGTIAVRYCVPTLGASPPPPDVEPLNYSPTLGLDLDTMSGMTVCPNGITLHANLQLGHSLTQMLSIRAPATSWFPVHCLTAQDPPPA